MIVIQLSENSLTFDFGLLCTTENNEFVFLNPEVLHSFTEILPPLFRPHARGLLLVSVFPATSSKCIRNISLFHISFGLIPTSTMISHYFRIPSYSSLYLCEVVEDFLCQSSTVNSCGVDISIIFLLLLYPYRSSFFLPCCTVFSFLITTRILKFVLRFKFLKTFLFLF